LTNLFFDFDDTLSEHALFNEQYALALGNELVARFGTKGKAETEWVECVVSMFRTLQQDYVARFADNSVNGYNDWYTVLPARAIELVFGGMRMPLPPEPKRIAVEMLRCALNKCDATFAGVSEALHALLEQGHTLHLASGNDSLHLAAALTGAGIADCFDRLYGPDLIDCAKEGTEFYRRLFTSSGIAPATAIVIDNDPNAVHWAQEAGAKAILVQLLDGLPPAETEAMLSGVPIVTAFSQLPEAIAEIVRSQN